MYSTHLSGILPWQARKENPDLFIIFKKYFLFKHTKTWHESRVKLNWIPFSRTPLLFFLDPPLITYTRHVIKTLFWQFTTILLYIILVQYFNLAGLVYWMVWFDSSLWLFFFYYRGWDQGKVCLLAYKEFKVTVTHLAN